MQRNSGYNSFPVLALGSVILSGLILVMAFGFGWVQLELAVEDEFTGELATGSVPAEGWPDELKLRKSVEIEVPAEELPVAENSESGEPEPGPFIALDDLQPVPSREEVLKQLGGLSQSAEAGHEHDEAIQPVEFVEETSPSRRFSRSEDVIESAEARLFPKSRASFEDVTDKDKPPAEADGGIGVRPGEKVPPLNGTDLDGVFHRLGEDVQTAAVAVIFLSPDCASCRKALPQVNRMASSFARKGVEFYGVISDRTTTRGRTVEFRKTMKLTFPLLFDTSGNLRSVLQPTHTPQVFVIDAGRTLVYTGRIDDRFVEASQRESRGRQFYLTRALQAVLDGRPVRVVETKPTGTLIDLAGQEPPVTYTRQIAPIVQAHCVGCHRPGEAGPFPLTNYEEVSSRARQISLVTQSRFMPPWAPVAGNDHFRGIRRLSQREIDLIAAWADSGAVHGPPAEEPPRLSLTPGWQLGRPDRVYRAAETFQLPPQREDVYQFFVIPSGLVREEMVTAVEFRPDNAGVIEHMVLYCDTGGEARRRDEAAPGPGYQNRGGPGFQPVAVLGRWVPGAGPHEFYPTTGRRLPANGDLVLQVHYRPSGKTERDRPRFALYFARDNVRQHCEELFVANPALSIPAGERAHRHLAEYRLSMETTIYSVFAHLRRLGRAVRVTAHPPGGEERMLLRIDDWDFQQQDHYTFRRPIRLPRGTVLAFEVVFDNSAGNPFNPYSPPQPVAWGDGAVDETALCIFDVTTDRPDDLRRLIQHNRQRLGTQVFR